MKCAAVRDGGDWVVNGTKHFISGAEHADFVIVFIATVAMYAFVINPISEQSADDEAALLVLSAQTWVELPPDARPYFELEMAESHDLIISEADTLVECVRGCKTMKHHSPMSCSD